MDIKVAKELLHIQAWLQRAHEIVQMGQQAYLNDDLLQEAGDGIMMKLGEAAKRLSLLEFPAPDDVDWSIAVANRNFIIHQYDEVNRNLTWFTLSIDLPKWNDSLRPLFDQAQRELNQRQSD
jgi:uncharacterized protein with HEPN domain